jgi:4-alpha-glucanotransferase
MAMEYSTSSGSGVGAWDDSSSALTHSASDDQTPFSAPFPPGYRGSGVLLHVSSLPSPYGIGDIGPSAFDWVDRLAEAGQAWWQVLPLGPTGFGDSPYQSFSSFTGNTLLISPDRLIEDGLLQASDCEGCSFPEAWVNYEAVIPFKNQCLARAWDNFRAGARPDLYPAFEQFCETFAAVLDDFALFMALKARHGGAAYQEWPAGVRRREPAALAQAASELAEVVDQQRFFQFLASRQWRRLREYAHERGVRLLGDLPFFVAPDSCDAWANPELFLLDAELSPKVLAGVPPDYFSPQGQLWGNPVYDWEALRRTGYHWWIARLRAVLNYLDGVRLDHFRAFEAAWHVPAGSATAASGKWIAGPGADFFDTARQALGRLPLLAEDLGMITPEVSALRDQFQLPGMRILQFAFDGSPDNPHLPDNFVPNTVVYTGTHDNDTTRGWYEALPERERQIVWRYLNRPPGESREVAAALIRLAWESKAALAIVPLQDLLNLDSAARMNTPGRAAGNWRWRFTREICPVATFEWLSELTENSFRQTPDASVDRFSLASGV